MDTLTMINGLLTLINVALVGCGIKIFSELVKWQKLESRR